MSNTINNAIPFVPENTIDPAAGLNLALNAIDVLLQLAVVTVGADTPPTGVEGNRYIVGTSPTGAWAGQANKVARYLDAAWSFYAARYALNIADGKLYVRSGSTWAVASGGSGGGDVTAVAVSSGIVDLSGKALSVDTFSVSLTSNVSTLTMPAGIAGKRVDAVIRFKQDATGGRTVNLSGITWPGTTPTVGAAANAITWITCSNCDNAGWEGFV